MDQRALTELSTAVRDLFTVRDLSSLIGLASGCSRRLIGADGSVFVVREGSFCFYAEEDGIVPSWKGRSVPIDTCICGWSMLNNTPVVIPNVRADTRVSSDVLRSVESLLIMPIRRPQPVGAIALFWKSSHEPSAEESHTMNLFTDIVGCAMRSFEAQQELRMRIHKLEATHNEKEESLIRASHELRTTLTALLGWAELLRGGGLNENERKAAHDAIFRSAQDQARCLDELLKDTEGPH